MLRSAAAHASCCRCFQSAQIGCVCGTESEWCSHAQHTCCRHLLWRAGHCYVGEWWRPERAGFTYGLNRYSAGSTVKMPFRNCLRVSCSGCFICCQLQATCNQAMRGSSLVKPQSLFPSSASAGQTPSFGGFRAPKSIPLRSIRRQGGLSLFTLQDRNLAAHRIVFHTFFGLVLGSSTIRAGRHAVALLPEQPEHR